MMPNIFRVLIPSLFVFLSACGCGTENSPPGGITLTAAPDTVGEEDGATTVTVTATVDGTTRYVDAKTVTVSVGGGTAISGTDYAAVSDFDITIAAGQASGSQTFTLTPTNDTLDEENETVDVTGSSGGITVTEDTITIEDKRAHSEPTPTETPGETDPPTEIPVDPGLSDISLPEGFSISFYSDKVPGARSLALGADGTLFVGTRSKTVYALSDTDGDNYAETVHRIANNLNTPNGVAFRDGALYVAEISRILRYDGIEGRLSSPPAPVVIIDTLPRDTHHGWKFIRFGPDGKLYVPVGAPCNVCKRDDERYAAILRVNPDGTGLEVFAHGVRNTVGFDWHPESGVLWFTDNGRDNISEDQRITDNSPPDELNRAGKSGLHFGFPYCHGADVEDPKFGSERRCDEFTPPQWKLPAHVAALGMRFYTGSMFPASWKNVIFIAEHGSWNRSVPTGYRVTSVRLDGSGNADSYDVFAHGWLESDGTAWGRPVDVLVAPDGALLVSDDRRGAVYRISR